MKQRLFAFVVLCIMLSSSATYAQKEGKGWLKTGDTLTYQVKIKNKQYLFIIRNLFIENNISFDWEMTSPNELVGNMVIGRHALDTATAQKNYFQDGESTILDRTTVWISKKVYNAVKKKKEIIINSGSGASSLRFVSRQDYTFKLNGLEKTVKVLFTETESGEKFWILDDKNNPLILKMNIGWTVNLLEINN